MSTKAKGPVAAGIAYGRRLRGLTQEDLAALLGCDVGYVIRVENDRRQRFTPDEITAFARALQLPVRFFIVGADSDITCLDDTPPDLGKLLVPLAAAA